MKKDIIIIGAGASGLMSAAEAGKRGRSVIVLDHSARIGNKIRVSGGGRCNFTNLNVGSQDYVSDNPHFCKSALSRFSPSDFLMLLERHRIRYHEKEDGQLFCSGNSLDILRMLQRECDDSGVVIRPDCRISDIRKDGHFTVITNHGLFESKSLVMATGGPSFPALGATDFGYRIARNFGLKVTQVRPALVPFTFHQNELRIFGTLSGISINAALTCNNKTVLGNILFTHNGLSGPAVLKTSLYWNPGDPISIDLHPGSDIVEIFLAKHQSRTEMRNLLSGLFPKRFAQTWCSLFGGSRPLCLYSLSELKKFAFQLHNWVVTPHGTEGFKNAEVTRGGIDTAELSSKTMETKKVAGLYYIGEVVDVTGQLGGYNLHWAWASGFTAGQYA